MKITVLETSPNAPNSIKQRLYHRVGGGEAAANSMMQMVFMLFGAFGHVSSTVMLINNHAKFHLIFTLLM